MIGSTWREGDAYERYMGRWSRRIAREFVRWLAWPSRGTWLDVGCGSGALSDAIEAAGAADSIVGLDRSPGFVAQLREKHDRERIWVVADATVLPLGAGAVDVAVSGLVLNFLEPPEAAVAELRRVTRPGGLVGAYVWSYEDGMAMLSRFWDVAGELDPGALALDEGARFSVCRPGPLRALFERAGCRSVEVTPIDMTAEFEDFDAYWQPFLGGQGPAPGYVASLTEEGRGRLRETLRQRLPTLGDGRIRLKARAWAVKGRSEVREATT